MGDTWLRLMEQRGRIPPSHRDDGGIRKFWFDDEADAIVAGTIPSAENEAAA